MPYTARKLAAIAGSAVIVSAISGCGAATVTTVRYHSARQVIAALDRGGLQCTGINDSNPPVVTGAISEASCSIAGLIDVFPGRLTRTQVLDDSASNGTSRIWSVTGPNWFVQATHADALRIQRILGGEVIAGPWHSLVYFADPQCVAAIADIRATGNDPSSQNLSFTPSQEITLGFQLSRLAGAETNSASSDAQLANDLGDAGINLVIAGNGKPGSKAALQRAGQALGGIVTDCTS